MLQKAPYDAPYRNSTTNPISLCGSTTSEVVDILELSYEYLSLFRNELMQEYGIEEYEGLLRQSLWYSKSQMSFEDFCEFHDLRNNFFVFFFGNFIGDCIRKQGFYIRFASENNPLNTKLMEIFSKGPLWRNVTKKEKELLYKAYRIMLGYDEVKNNESLLI